MNYPKIINGVIVGLIVAGLITVVILKLLGVK